MRSLTSGLVFVLSLTAGSHGREKPDFSGAWVASKDAPVNIAAAPGATFGARFWLQQSGDRLTVIRPVRDFHVATTYPLDGSDVRSRTPGGVCIADAESIETATWEGDAIVLALVNPPGGGAPVKPNVKRVFQLQEPDRLTVQATLRAASGESRQVATVYKRSSDPVPPVYTPPAGQRTGATLEQLAWISGTWIGSFGTTTVEEHWTPATGGSMLGTSRTLRGGAMTSFEFLCIVERNGGLVYTAMPNARTPATDFTLTTATPDSVTFENPQHDFPKLVRYTRRPDGSLETMIGGDPKQGAETVMLKRRN